MNNISISTNNFQFNNNIISKRNYSNNNVKGNISFKGKYPNDISKFLDENIDYLLHSNSLNLSSRIKFHKVINELLPNILTPENFLNKGRESKVYKISDKYVAKVKRGFYAKDAVKFYNMTHLPDKRFSSLDFYYGEPVIRLGNTEILKNATPTNDFICCGTSYRGAHSATLDEIQNYENIFVPKCAALPQESYDKFAKGLAELNKISTRKMNLSKVYYTPDIINPNNILISDNDFKIVDKLDKTNQKEPNTLFTMLEPLLLRLSPESYARFNEKLLQPRNEIFKKCLIASEKAQLPIENSLKYEFSDYYLGDILRNNNVSFIESLKSSRNNGDSVNVRLDLINKVLP